MYVCMCVCMCEYYGPIGVYVYIYSMCYMGLIQYLLIIKYHLGHITSALILTMLLHIIYIYNIQYNLIIVYVYIHTYN